MRGPLEHAIHSVPGTTPSRRELAWIISHTRQTLLHSIIVRFQVLQRPLRHRRARPRAKPCYTQLVVQGTISLRRLLRAIQVLCALTSIRIDQRKLAPRSWFAPITREDTNCDIYPIKEGERLTFVLASTLDLSGKPDDGTFKPLGDEVREGGGCGAVGAFLRPVVVSFVRRHGPVVVSVDSA